jgi:SAM-dependent methyltransferase
MVEIGSPCTKENQAETISKRVAWIGGGVTSSCRRMLDIGCGFGEYETAFSGRGFEMIGIDISRENLLKCPALPKASFCCASAENLPFADESFDAVIIIEVLEHVQDAEKTLREMQRVLSKGGTALLTVPNRGFPFLTHGYRIGRRKRESFFGIPLPLGTYLPNPLLRRIWLARHYRCSDLKKLIRQAGLEVDDTVFLMPAFDNAGSPSRLPASIRMGVRRMLSKFDAKQSSWFGFSIAVRCHKA